METAYSKKPWIKLTVEDLKTPSTGRLCLGGMWWAVTEDDCVLFYKSFSSPQANASKGIVERIRPGCKAVFIEMSFIPHDCQGYV